MDQEFFFFKFLSCHFEMPTCPTNEDCWLICFPSACNCGKWYISYSDCQISCGSNILLLYYLFMMVDLSYFFSVFFFLNGIRLFHLHSFEEVEFVFVFFTLFLMLRDLWFDLGSSTSSIVLVQMMIGHDPSLIEENILI